MSASARERILEQGIELLLRKGVAASGLTAMLRAAEVPKGSFYHHFPGGKEAFVIAAVERYAEQSRLAREETLGDVSRAPLERLKRHFEVMYLDFERGEWSHGCLLGNLSAEAADEYADVRTLLDASFSAWIADIASVLRELPAQPAGSVDAATTARLMVGGWEGAILLMKTRTDPGPLRDFMALWFGTGATPGLLPAR